MIESIEFKNFKVLRDCTLPLSPCTILIGPNGSGKSTVLQALEILKDDPKRELARFLSRGSKYTQETGVELKFTWRVPEGNVQCLLESKRGSPRKEKFHFPKEVEPDRRKSVQSAARNVRVFSLDADAIAAPSIPGSQLGSDGSGLAGLLFRLRDSDLERFEAITADVTKCLPDFDRILFPASGEEKTLVLRTREGRHRIYAFDLSQGTLIALAILTLANMPGAPSVIGLEEPDRGIHPRLLRHIKDALYHLSRPESHGETRAPVQVIATTHSPYFIDLFREHPEEIVICEKTGLDVQFKRVSEMPHIEEILGDEPLGEAWFTGVLGGVPARP